ncbi:MAG: P1 family peptidase [Acidimicrobiia bacterium]
MIRAPGELAPGFRVGHWTGARTGVTVVVCPPDAIGSGEVRGGAPATRELALLDPARVVEHVDAVVFTGGSAFGLATADGVTAWLEEHGRGFPTRGGRVPIVPTAAIYDLIGAEGERPGAGEGRAAAEAADRGDELACGRVGAGRGATVGKWLGPEYAVAGGLGVARAEIGGATVGALAVVNAVGDVVDADGRVLAGSSAPDSTEPFPELPFAESTTLVVVATDAACTKVECHLVAQSGHLGIAYAVRPSHTRHDGDVVVAVASGTHEVHLDRLRITVADTVAEAVRAAVRHHDG